MAKSNPYDGRFKVVMDRLQSGDKDGALDEAKRWQTDQPGDVMALVALGEAYEARGDVKTAARAYGSILELFSFRADSRRFAGERLERLADPGALRLAADTYGKAAEQRPDHPASHRLYAFALLKAGEHEKAFEAMKKGAMRSYPAGRFRGVDRILKEDLGLIAAVWAAAAPREARGDHDAARMRPAAARRTVPSLRFVLVWETDANDVDFHIHDGKGGHAFYGDAEPPLGRRALRRRHDRLRPRVLHHPRRARDARVSVHAPGALLLARPDGLRHGQARDHRARRPGAHLLRGASVRRHERPRLRRPRHGREDRPKADRDGLGQVTAFLFRSRTRYHHTA